METGILERKACPLGEYCKDFHPIGIEVCEGKKDYTVCPLYKQHEHQIYDVAGITV